MAALKMWKTARYNGQEFLSGGFTIYQNYPYHRTAHGLEYWTQGQRDTHGGTHGLELVYIAGDQNRRAVINGLTYDEALRLAKSWVTIVDEPIY